MMVLETERLRLRRLTVEDADFMLELLNEPAFLKHVGDRNLRSTEDARQSILSGPMASYAQHGFGVLCVELKDSGVAVGICGLIKRDWLEAVDLGYSYLERFWSRGYAHEAGAAMLDHGRRVVGLDRVVAITSPGNAASIRVLEKLGMSLERTITMPGGTESTLFTTRWDKRAATRLDQQTVAGRPWDAGEGESL